MKYLLIWFHPPKELTLSFYVYIHAYSFSSHCTKWLEKISNSWCLYRKMLIMKNLFHYSCPCEKKHVFMRRFVDISKELIQDKITNRLANYRLHFLLYATLPPNVRSKRLQRLDLEPSVITSIKQGWKILRKTISKNANTFPKRWWYQQSRVQACYL